MNSHSFEEKVLLSLEGCIFLCGSSLGDAGRIGVAVSGGADSLSLLVALRRILRGRSELFAVTVNHGLRGSESDGDASFVQSLCSSLGVECSRFDVEPGRIHALAEIFGGGIEDAARRERYSIFDKFIEENQIDFLCLAHNRNDALETVIMRFIQGSSALGGIPAARGRYVRPLLEISRAEIEAYLAENGVEFRTDSTNSDEKILRNSIRRRILPFLQAEFPGCDGAILSLAQKQREAAAALEFYAGEAMKEIGFEAGRGGNSVSFSADKFLSLPIAVRERIFLSAYGASGGAGRIPFDFVRRACMGGFGKKISCAGIEAEISGGIFLIQKKQNVATETGFFVIIEEDGFYSAGSLSVGAVKTAAGIDLSCGDKKIALAGAEYPLAFRSRQPCDDVACASGGRRPLSRIFDDWKAGPLRDRIPVVQNLSRSSGADFLEILCVWGDLFGLKNWIVGGSKGSGFGS